ncbi:MAG: sterol desaturase family protein [Bernardetiaceae bacterium]
MTFEFFLTHDPVRFAVPLFLFLLALEAGLSAWERRGWYHLPDTWASLAMGAGSVLTNLLAKLFYFGIFTFLYERLSIWKIPDDAVWAWVLLFFLDDWTFYWHHRLSHEIRLLWASHANHHSSECYNLSTALRQSWTEYLYKYIFWLWLPVVGFPPLMILTMMSLSLIYQFFLHTPTVRHLGWLEYVFNTPSHHRVHHASNDPYLDKNHGAVLIIWDRLLGTFMAEDPDNPPVYGLTTNINTYVPHKIAFAEHRHILKDLRRAPTLSDRLKYLWGKPGWTHEKKT